MKIYKDKVRGIEVFDVSGKKTKAEINKEFQGRFSDITESRAAELAEIENKKQEELSAKKALKESAKTKLVAMGLSAEEVAALTGV